MTASHIPAHNRLRRQLAVSLAFEMIVKVVLAGKQHEVLLAGESETLLCLDLIAACSEQPHVPPDRQRLLHKGKVLQSDDSLSNCGVADGAKLMLLATGASTQARVPPRLSFPCTLRMPRRQKPARSLPNAPLHVDTSATKPHRAVFCQCEF